MHYKNNSVIKCLSIDLDGTLITPGHRTYKYIHPDNIQAMKEFCKTKGNKIVISTGKTIQNTVEIFEYLQTQSFTPEEIPYLICLNGAAIVDTTQLNKTIYQNCFDKNICQQIFEHLSSSKLHFLAFTTNGMIHSLSLLSFLAYYLLFKKKHRKCMVLERSCLTNLQKILIISSLPISDKKIKKISEELKESCYLSKVCKCCWEITDKRIDKFFGLQIVAKKLGLHVRDFAAMGNEQNDVMSLENVGFGVGINLSEKLNCVRDKIELFIENTTGTAVSDAIYEMKNRNLW